MLFPFLGFSVGCALGLSWGCVDLESQGVGEPVETHFHDAFSPERAKGFRFAHDVSLQSATLDHERREVFRTRGGWSWTGSIGPSMQLALGVGLESNGNTGARLHFEVESAREESSRQEFDLSSEHWNDFHWSLDPWRGQTVTLRSRILEEGSDSRSAVLWSPLTLAPTDPVDLDRLNVVLIVVDTLRADHLQPYGYSRETSPQIQRLLADQGLVVEKAYSSAPWTLPSMASLWTGRFPGEIMGKTVGDFSIPPNLKSLPEYFLEAGYATGGFTANPLLRDSNHFGRGFQRFYSAPYEMQSAQLHADSVQARVEPWLASFQNRPFFLYVHYMDPHDPYVNPDQVDGRSVFYPDYEGSLEGKDIHSIYTGQIAFEPNSEDRRQLEALYDSEIRYVDRFIGQLVESIPAAVQRQTLFVLTSDHGEELWDHGGLKHGRTLYEEQIRVPLILRLDGQLKPGSRVPGIVRQVDMLETILAAAGLQASPSRGKNLWPSFRSLTPISSGPAFAQSLG